MSALAYRGSREPVVLLEDSVFRVRQFVQNLSQEAADALAANPYTVPSTTGIDRETECAYCATPASCYVWRSNSANPTCYAFSVPPTSSGAPPLCVVLPRPLNDSAEPAVLLASVDGHVRFWEGVSDALTSDEEEAIVTQLPLDADEVLTAAARIDVRS